MWYIGKDDVALAVEERPKGAEDNILLHHRRLGHPSFQNMSKMYGELFNKVDKRKLMCDACELGKHDPCIVLVVLEVVSHSYINTF